MSIPDSKYDRILDSSLAVFCRYGFHKTSMQDIAQAAGMSRAALYLLFANKDDVFRSGSIRTHDRVMAQVRADLANTGPTIDRIEAALLTYFEGVMQEIADSPHGYELFDASVELVGDVVSNARRHLVELLADALAEAEKAGEVDLSEVGATEQELATLLVAGIDGLKHDRASALSVTHGISLHLRLVRLSVVARG